jgi:hypothetical protein
MMRQQGLFARGPQGNRESRFSARGTRVNKESRFLRTKNTGKMNTSRVNTSERAPCERPTALCQNGPTPLRKRTCGLLVPGDGRSVVAGAGVRPRSPRGIMLSRVVFVVTASPGVRILSWTRTIALMTPLWILLRRPSFLQTSSVSIHPPNQAFEKGAPR